MNIVRVASNTSRSLVTVGSDKSDHTYDLSMSPKHYADATNAALVNAPDGEIFLRGETVGFTNASGKVVTPVSNVAVRGAGVNKTLIQTARTDYVFKNTAAALANFCLIDMTIDCQSITSVSGFEMRKFDNFRISRVKFKNSTQWFGKSSNEPAASTSDINTNLTVEDSIFDTHDGIYEMLLVFNTYFVDINRSIFKNKTGSAGAAPTLGFWQKVEYARVRNTRFQDLVGDAIYYGFTANHISIEDCDFANVRKGLHGAIVSDYGKFGTKFVSDIAIRNSRFIGGSNSTASEAIQIGAVHGFSVTDSYIEAHAKGIKIGFGNDVPSASDGGDAKFPSVWGKINNVTFKDINPLGTNKTLNSPIYFNNGGDFKNLLISDITVQDDNNYLSYAVIFNGATTATATLNTGAVSAISLSTTTAWYDTAPAVTITGDGTGATATATIDSDGRVTGFTVTNGGSGYTTATVSVQGAKYKNITFIDCDFGGKQIRVNDNAQVEFGTSVKFINCRNFDTSNLSTANVNLAVFNNTSFVMHDGKLGVGITDIDVNANLQVGDGTATVTFRLNNTQEKNSNDNIQKIFANFTGKTETYYKNNTNSGSRRMVFDVDTGVFSSNGFDANLGTDITTAGIVAKRLTTAQRDALVGVSNGSTIYNVSLDKFQGYQAGAWVDLS